MEKKTYEFRVEMTCEGCSGALEKILNKFKGNGIDNFHINLKDKTVKVETNTLSKDEIVDIIKKCGKAVEFVSTT